MRTALWFAHLAALTLAVAALAPHEPAEAAAAPEPEFAVWSGSSLIVFSAYGSRGGTYAIRPDGGGLRRLTTAGETQPVVSPDGRTLLLSSDGSLVTIGIDGGGKRALGKGFAAAWSPDGRRIAFNRNDGVYLMRADGTGAHKLVTNRYAYYAPAWSPDGKKVAYVACSAPHGSVPCEHQSGFDVYVIGVDGTGKHRVTPRSGYPSAPPGRAPESSRSTRRTTPSRSCSGAEGCAHSALAHARCGRPAGGAWQSRRLPELPS